MMDLVQLRSFAEVAERGTVAAAAVALEYTPPAVSQHVAKLEAELDSKLFDRAGRRLRLTAAGDALLPVALQMIDLEYQGREAVGRPEAQPHYAVAGFASALSTLVLPKLQDMRETMTVKLIESEDAEALRDLRVGALDLVLTQEYQGQPTERDPRLRFTPMVTDQLKLVLPAKFPASTRVGQLRDEQWLVNGEGTRCTDATLRILDAAGMAPTIGASVADNDTLLALVAAGHGVTIVPELLLTKSQSAITVATEMLGISRTILAVNRVIANNTVAPLIDLLTHPASTN